VCIISSCIIIIIIILFSVKILTFIAVYTVDVAYFHRITSVALDIVHFYFVQLKNSLNVCNSELVNDGIYM